METNSVRRLRTGLEFGAVVLIAGLTWHTVRAETRPAAAPVQTAAAVAAASHDGKRDSYAAVVTAAAPAVVTIRVEGHSQEPLPFRQRGLGSGVVVGSDGYILTNHHVVNGADDIRVDLTDGRTFKASLIGSDAPSDLALLKIAASNLPALMLGNSDAVEVGDVVLALGNPLGIGQTVTMGIISAKSRATGLGEDGYEEFLQTDAPINQGNSGGALVNTSGELIGINSQILSPSGGNIGIGFAIPANMANHVMTQLRTTGHVRRAQLGISVQSVTSDLAESIGLKDVAGAMVSAVRPESPAEQAGVHRGDVILAFNGHKVKDSNALRNRVADAGPGSQATLLVTRGGREYELKAKLGEVATTAQVDDQNTAGAAAHASLGVAVQPLTPELAREIGLPRSTHGLLVQQVDPEGRAAAGGLEEGDVIEEVNQQPVHTVEALRAAVHQASSRPLLMLVNRDGRDLFLTASAS